MSHLYSNRDKINPSKAVRLETVGPRGWRMGGKAVGTEGKE